MESHAVPTLAEKVLYGWISWASASLLVLKNQETNCLSILDELDILDQGGPLYVFVLGKLRAKERDLSFDSMYLTILLGTCQAKGSSDLDNREKMV